MKKIICFPIALLLLIGLGLQQVQAQKSGDTAALSRRAAKPIVNKNNTPQTTLVNPLTATPSKTALSRLPKRIDLAVSDLRIQKDIATGLYTSEADRTLKPGQSLLAKTIHPTPISWSKPDTCPAAKIEVMLSLDPINRIGDQDISNNILKAYFPVQK